MKVKVPEQIKVGSLVYNIVLTDNLGRDYRLLGQCLTDEGVIKIDSVSSKQVKAISLLHELVHAISDTYSCELDEKDISRLAHGLADVLKGSFDIEFDWEGK